MSTFPHIPSEGAETVALIIKKVAEVPDLLGNVEVIQRTIISSSIMTVKRKTNIEFKNEKKSIIFKPLVYPQVDKT